MRRLNGDDGGDTFVGGGDTGGNFHGDSGN